jgi:hypothetical protein
MKGFKKHLQTIKDEAKDSVEFDTQEIWDEFDQKMGELFDTTRDKLCREAIETFEETFGKAPTQKQILEIRFAVQTGMAESAEYHFGLDTLRGYICPTVYKRMMRKSR